MKLGLSWVTKMRTSRGCGVCPAHVLGHNSHPQCLNLFPRAFRCETAVNMTSHPAYAPGHFNVSLRCDSHELICALSYVKSRLGVRRWVVDNDQGTAGAGTRYGEQGNSLEGGMADGQWKRRGATLRLPSFDSAQPPR